MSNPPIEASPQIWQRKQCRFTVLSSERQGSGMSHQSDMRWLHSFPKLEGRLSQDFPVARGHRALPVAPSCILAGSPGFSCLACGGGLALWFPWLSLYHFPGCDYTGPICIQEKVTTCPWSAGLKPQFPFARGHIDRLRG